MKTAIGILIALIIIGGAFFLYEKRDADNGNIVATSTPVIVTSSSTPATTTPSTGTSGTGNTGGSTVSTADIKITSPKSGQTVSSPLTLTGEARGNWFFEATAPVLLKDASGKTIAQGHITATGEWMTTNFVPFTGTLTWSAASAGTSTKATLVFMNDNPSGDPALQKTVTVPVVLSR